MKSIAETTATLSKAQLPTVHTPEVRLPAVNWGKSRERNEEKYSEDYESSEDVSSLPAIERILYSLMPEAKGNRFEVDSLDRAGWASSKYLEADKRIEERTILAEDYKRRIDDWVIRSNRDDRETQGYMKTLIEPYARGYISRQKRGKSFRVFGAKIGFRSGHKRVEITDPDLALGFCEEHYPEAVAVKKEVSKSAIKQYLLDGIDIPGVAIVAGDEILEIKGE
jgi:hypothetical protein